jgi:hypothetical protein
MHTHNREKKSKKMYMYCTVIFFSTSFSPLLSKTIFKISKFRYVVCVCLWKIFKEALHSKFQSLFLAKTTRNILFSLNIIINILEKL